VCGFRFLSNLGMLCDHAGSCVPFPHPPNITPTHTHPPAPTLPVWTLPLNTSTTNTARYVHTFTRVSRGRRTKAPGDQSPKPTCIILGPYTLSLTPSSFLASTKEAHTHIALPPPPLRQVRRRNLPSSSLASTCLDTRTNSQRPPPHTHTHCGPSPPRSSDSPHHKPPHTHRRPRVDTPPPWPRHAHPSSPHAIRRTPQSLATEHPLIRLVSSDRQWQWLSHWPHYPHTPTH
jgi:hypothetical protein